MPFFFSPQDKPAASSYGREDRGQVTRERALAPRLALALALVLAHAHGGAHVAARPTLGGILVGH
eukprot:6839188-Pyramimonas_sp.AAC.1